MASLSAHSPAESDGRQLSSRARDFEERAGERSAQRIALEVAAPIIREAGSWDEMHEALGREGVRFERKGSGAILWIGERGREGKQRRPRMLDVRATKEAG
jgi:hypothetical protein